MGSRSQVLGPELFTLGWLHPPSLGTKPPPARTELQLITALLFWERALKSADDEKGRDSSTSQTKTKQGFSKCQLSKGVILAEQELPSNERR